MYEIIVSLWEFLSHIMHQLLMLLFKTTHSYGLSIILMTVIVKFVLTPLTQKQFHSMKELQKLQPKLKEVQEKYKGKPQELQKRMMEMYKQHGVSPFGSCLPMIVQMPVLIILYRTVMSFRDDFVIKAMLWANFSAKGLPSYSDTSFLWMPSLLSPDMPLLIMYGFSMYLSQTLTMLPSLDPAQQQSQKMMSVMMPFFFVMMFQTFPSGFILYWLTYNVLSTGHQYLIMHPVIREERMKQKLKENKNGDASPANLAKAPSKDKK